MTAAFITQPLVRSAIRHPKLAEVTGHPRPRYKGHWAVGTRNLEQSNSFYEALAATEVICRPAPFSTAVSWDVEHHRFFIMDVAGMKRDPATGAELKPLDGTPQERTGVGAASIRFGSLGSIARVHRHMDEKGWLPEKALDKGATVSLIYRDPDGLLVEVFAATGEPEHAPSELDQEALISRLR